MVSSAASEVNNPVISTTALNAWFGTTHAVKAVSLKFYPKTVGAIIGPSGCGKSTFLRCLNRMHEEIPGARASGVVEFQGRDIYGWSVDPSIVRRQIGMVFQKPNPFPAMSIFENVIIGLKLSGVRKGFVLRDVAEDCLKRVALWDEVKEKLNAPGLSLSGGQQQRLCIARALAMAPEVILMDEPTSALDPISTARIEELLVELKKSVSIVIVTHNMQQAARISDTTSFFLSGDLIESGPTGEIFTNPKRTETENYITGRFG
jgi:phosphate transport system ATP-binding protein